MDNSAFLKTQACSLELAFVKCLHRLCAALCTVPVIFIQIFELWIHDGSLGRGGLRKNSRMMKRQSDGNGRRYSGEVAKTQAMHTPAMAGELRNTNSACSSLQKTHDEVNPTVTPGPCSVTMLFPTSPFVLRVLQLVSVKYLLRPLKRAEVWYLFQLARPLCGLIDFSGFIPFMDFVSS